jgi:hypothetical protein
MSVRDAVKTSHDQLIKRLPNQRTEQIEDFPSEISVDEWGEVQKYSKILDLETKKKEKEDYLRKQLQVKQTLEEQIQSQKVIKEIQL